MKKYTTKIVSYILSIAFLLCIIPSSVFAANNESVLTSIGHTDTDIVNLSGSTRNITLTVPNSYTGDTIDLSTGLIINYNTKVYSYAIATPESIATINGDYVKITVTYQRVNSAEQGTTVYQVKVVRAAAKSASFTGTILKNAQTVADISFTVDEFTERYQQNDDKEITHISITGSNPVFGSLMLAGSQYTLGTPIPLASIPNLVFKPTESGTISYIVKAYAGGDTQNPIGSVILTISIVGAPRILSDISKNVAVNNTLEFSLSDFEACINNNGGNLEYIEITPTNNDFGTWYLGSTSFKDTKTIAASLISTLKFTAKTEGVATFTWRVSNQTGYSSYGNGTITVKPIGLPVIRTSINTSVSSGSKLTFTVEDFTNACYLNEGKLVNIEITPTNTGFGTWYSGRTILSQATTFTSTTIKNLNFVGGAIGIATFKWRVSNETGYSDYGIGSITVTDALSIFDYTSYSSVAKGDVWTISPWHFSYTPTTKSITYIKIVNIPNSKDGYLYLTTALSADANAGYSAISANTPIAKNAVLPYSYAQYLRLFTQPTTTSDSISFTWTATTSNTLSSDTTWAVQKNYTVYFATAGTVVCSTNRNTPVTLDAVEFNTAFYNETRATLSHVYFNLPNTTQGKLYYNYVSDTQYESVVSTKTAYYRNSLPYLSYVTFVPAKDFTGTVSIEFTAYTTSGVSYNGTLKIYVGVTGGGNVTYNTLRNSPVTFSANDFVNAFTYATGLNLAYVKFTLPPSSFGKLYYNYVSSTVYEAAVASTTKYYVNGSPYLSYVTFVPTTGYSGTVKIDYTGYTATGVEYSGTLTIYVGVNQGGNITYSTEKNTPVTFNPKDFNNVFSSVTGTSLYYVTFTPPIPSYGTLYYKYISPSVYSSVITSDTRFYSSNMPNISEVTFVPYAGYSGTVTLSYTGYATSGVSYTGTIQIFVGVSEGGTVTMNISKDSYANLNSSDFSREFSLATGYSLSYVKFALPPTTVGKLYYNYASPKVYEAVVAATTKYYVNGTPNISNVSFVPNTGYTGTVTIGYTAYTSTGTSYNGTLKINVVEKSKYFNDVDQNISWAIEAIDYLYEKGVINGVDTGLYSPSSNMKRGDFMIILCKAFNLKSAYTGNFADVPIGSYYYDAIAIAKALGIAQGDGSSFSPDSPITRQDAMVLVARTMELKGMKLTKGNSEDLAKFTDRGQVSTYAIDAVATLVKSGIIEGSDSLLNPKGNVTRAEMAVIVYRILK